MYYTDKYLLLKDMMNTAQSRTLNPVSLTTRSGRVTTSAQAVYRLFMRHLGYGLTAFTLAFVALLAAQAQPMKQASDLTPPTAPRWTAAHAHQFPGCVGTGSFVPARIVVIAREGNARAMPYTKASIARIDATWANDDAWDDLYTIGKCAH